MNPPRIHDHSSNHKLTLRIAGVVAVSLLVGVCGQRWGASASPAAASEPPPTPAAVGAVVAPAAIGTPGEAMIEVVREAPGDHCASGGYLVLVGKDDDRTGTIDDAEIEDLYYLCRDDVGGHPLVLSSRVVPHGSDCANGGVALDWGHDSHADGLDGTDLGGVEIACNR